MKPSTSSPSSSSPGNVSALPLTARDRILGKLRASLAASPGQPGADASAVQQHAATHTPDWPLPERLQRFIRAMVAVQTEVHLVDEASWPQRLAHIAQTKGLRQVLMAPQTRHGARAAAALRELAPSGTGPSVRAYDGDIESFKPELFSAIDAGFTRARSGIAQTGSLVIWPDIDEPRTLSLVPPVHLALLDGSAMHATFQQAMAAEGWAQASMAGGMPTNALLVSGPSKTSDIQQTLAYGAHGPRQLVLLLVLPEGIDPQALAAATGALA
jgi:L-lactate dehydrogenase complex protein LldG